MPRKIYRTIAGRELLAALQASQHIIKIFTRTRQSPDKMPAPRAIPLVKSGIFEGIMHGTRLKSIRETDPRPPAPFVPCWRNTGAAVCPPPAGWHDSQITKWERTK